MLTSTIEWPPSYKIKKHRRAKHVKLRACAMNGLVVTVPYRFNISQIPSIIEENKIWIEKHLHVIEPVQPDILPDKIELHACDEVWCISYLGADTKLQILQRSHLKEIAIVGNIHDENLCKLQLITWLKKQAKLYLPKLLMDISLMMQLSYTKVTIRDQKTLWGSCTVDKSINLNYKLLLLPAHLATHILIHELSHLIHLNHSDKFWNLVAKYDPKWKDHRRELRQADKLIPRWIRNF